MGNILRLSGFLLVVTVCHAKHCSEAKIDAINKTALSLEIEYHEIKNKADSLVAGGCCSSVGLAEVECVCAPIPIVDGPSPITLITPGIHCLTMDLPTKELNPGSGVTIDLNGHSIYNVSGGSNFVVKNGTVLNELAGINNMVGYNLKVSLLTGGAISMLPGSLTLIDCTGLNEIKGVDNGLLIRCSGGDDDLSIHTQTHSVTIIDSYFDHEISGESYLESLKMYRSTLKLGLSLSSATHLKELCFYDSTLGNVSLIGAYTNPVRMLIESSVLGNCEFGQVGGVTTFVSGLITRSLLGQALFKRCVGVTINASEVVGECSFQNCENITCTNDSVHQADGGALIIDGGSALELHDCFASASSSGLFDAAYSFNETTTLNLLNCYAQGSPIGFLINNPTDGFTGVIKECVADGCSQASYKQFNLQAKLYSYGNIAISNGGVPSSNYDGALSSFNPVITSLTAIETDTVTSWRNISFELP